MRFVTLFTRGENMHLTKDVGLIPWHLSANHRVRASLACLHNSESYPDLKKLPGLFLEFIRESRLGSIASGLGYLWRKGRRIDVLNLYHLNLSSFVYSLYFRIFCPHGRIWLKLDMADNDLAKLRGKGPVVWVKKRTLGLAHYVTAESTYMQREVQKLTKKRIDYLPDGTYAPRHTEVFEKEKLILTVGRLGTEQKATELLLEAFAKAELPSEWKLMLTGTVEESFLPEKEKFYQEHPDLTDRVIFTGPIYDREALSELYRRAAIFVLPSRWESFGLVLAEALFEGDYLIGSDCIPPMEDLTDKGRLGMSVPTGDVSALSKALRTAIEKKDILSEKRAAEAAAYARKHFDWKPITDELYRRLRSLTDRS